MTLMNQKEFAELCGVSKKTVTTWKKAKRLVLQGDRVDVEASLAMLERYRRGGAPKVTLEGNRQGNQGNREGNSEEAQNSSTAPSTAEQNERDITIRPGESAEEAAVRLVATLNPDMDYDEARRVEMNYRALKSQLEYDRDSGIVVLVADVAKAVGAEYAKTRTKLLSLPSSLAPKLLRLKTAPDMCNALEQAITAALEELTLDAA